jgi:sec-independent protein translocase protein TatB
MFGIGPWEFALIAVVGLLVFGPDRLPKMAADAARFLRDVRRMAASARQDLTEALGTELPDLDLGDLNPKTFLKSNVLDVLDDVPDARRPNGNGSSATASGSEVRGGRPAPDSADDQDRATADETMPPSPGYDADTT